MELVHLGLRAMMMDFGALMLWLCGCSLLLSVFSIWSWSNVFKYFNFFDSPDGRLKLHETPVPPAGGPGVFLSLSIAFVATAFYQKLSSVLIFSIFTFLFFALGLIDDIFSISQKKKLVLQFLLVSIFLFLIKPQFNIFELFWVISVINAFNLIDIADGLCFVISNCAAFGFLFISAFFGLKAWMLFFSCLIGSLFGFSFYNLPPARVYLGDSGSTLLGAIFALAPLLFPWKSRVDELLVSTIILGLPLIEVFFLVLIRSYLRISPLRGSPHHFYIFLKNSGWRPKKILAFVFSVGCLLSFLGCALLSGHISKLFLITFGIFSTLIWTIVVYF